MCQNSTSELRAQSTRIGEMPIQAELEPEFLQALENHTVTQGRDVHFTCVVNHLSNYRCICDSKT
ncbi:hypothetical protein SFRURICE_015544 [Spodoptera frugiperda]|nr:hypothetical protein SFRURICE_015544 [Spodoptera frugiperda]